ncbi:actyltransferase-like protein [Leptomonas seymouri]|uniref:Actyltransferase-like protein n=1 Tax=Leptomonas seymouri TaxID=5684 RepID=A0A0N1I6B9_LEPSE|nr:actyltransferase-like protein [Leptomonas seymouri]|eukprot:KPI88634.1 actyltransferase-like protein [Leptomonas seymouri]
MSAPAADDAASRLQATAARWEKLEEVVKLVTREPDAKALFNKYTVIRSVVGEVKPVFSDALQIRSKVFYDKHGAVSQAECDDFDAVSVHVVMYFNYTLFSEEMEELVVQARLLKSIGMEGSGLRFQHRKKNVSVAGVDTRYPAHGARRVTVMRTPEANYKAPVLIPVGCMRLRRAAKAPRAGKLLEVVARMERLCVVATARNFDIGRALMAAAEDIARDACHVRWALLYTPLDAREFYIKVGYVAKDGWVFYKGQKPFLAMIKCLADASL